MLKKILCLLENTSEKPCLSEPVHDIQALEQALQREKALRISYEKALGLPFYDRQQTHQALLSLSAQGQTWASDVLQEALASVFETPGIDFAGVSENQSV